MSNYISGIDIQRYRGITSLKLDKLQRINILTGDNNSGKTSVLEVLSILKNPAQFSSWLDVSRGDGAISGLSVYERMNDLFNVNFERKQVKYSIEFEDEQMEIELNGFDSIVEMPEKEYYSKIGVFRVYEDEEENGTSAERLTVVPKTELELKVNHQKMGKWSVYEGQWRTFLSARKGNNGYARKVVHVSPFSHVSGNIYLKEILNNPDLYEEMLEVLKAFDPGILSINYDNAETPRSGGYYKILSKENNKALPLNMYGDGMKKAILLMSAVVKAKDGILLLDEFETAIHTSAMDQIFSWILKTCMRLNIQVFLTSHSKEAIEKVLNCSDDLQSNMAIYTLYRDGEGCSVRRMMASDAILLKNEMGLELR